MAAGRRPPCWKILEMPYLGNQSTDWDETWVVASHHVPDMFTLMRLPWQRALPSNGALNILQSLASEGQTREPILMKYGIQQQIRTKMTVM